MGSDLQKNHSRNKLASKWHRRELPEREFWRNFKLRVKYTDKKWALMLSVR